MLEILVTCCCFGLRSCCYFLPLLLFDGSRKMKGSRTRFAFKSIEFQQLLQWVTVSTTNSIPPGQSHGNRIERATFSIQSAVLRFLRANFACIFNEPNDFTPSYTRCILKHACRGNVHHIHTHISTLRVRHLPCCCSGLRQNLCFYTYCSKK